MKRLTEVVINSDEEFRQFLRNYNNYKVIRVNYPIRLPVFI
jgi:hypothetical protein